jgi:hypothetical protein
MRKIKTADGFFVYRIKKERKTYYLANKTTYIEEINQLLNNLEELKFDSVIFIFGLDTGAYIDKLIEHICVKNKVFIIEPNKKIIKKFKDKLPDSIQVLYFDLKLIKDILKNTIHERNFNNIYVHAFGNYKELYADKYNAFIEQLDDRIVDVSTSISIANRFREVFLQNMIANVKIIAESTPIHHYIFSNLNVPALVISGGPSLDRNIEELIKHREKLDHTFIIAGSRTVGALIKNGIRPDLIVSIDPVNANYDMMKDYLDLGVPLAFYENSNRYLLRDYTGDKIYIAELLPQILEECKNLKGLYLGGSVAHSCIDLANMLGCSPIILLGQDLAYTQNRHHAQVATHEYDHTLIYAPQIFVKDVFGNQIHSSLTLDLFRQTLEKYIEIYNNVDRIEFINCSYGADIKGAPHIELEEVFKRDIFIQDKNICVPRKDINLDVKKVIDSILAYIDECLIKADIGLELCELVIKDNESASLVEVGEDDINLQRFHSILQMIHEFEHSPKSRYLGGLLYKFLYDIKEKSFLMYAKDYEKLTSDMQYQARAFYSYFTDMKEMLIIAKELANKTVDEFYN